MLYHPVVLNSASTKNSSHAGLQMPPAICQLYAAVLRDMPIRHPGHNKDLAYSGHRKKSVHPLYLRLPISVFHCNMVPAFFSPPLKEEDMWNLK